MAAEHRGHPDVSVRLVGDRGPTPGRTDTADTTCSTMGTMTDISVRHDTTTTLALKEWGAVVHALLDGRQTVLLRKGGIRERRFDVARDRFVLFPTVAHAHAERVRDGHSDVLAAGAADVDEHANTFVVRAGVELIDVIATADAAGLADLVDLHIWKPEHIAERLAFRPRHPLQVLVVRAVALPRPVTLDRRPDHGGCSSWVDLHVDWTGEGVATHHAEHLRAVAARVRDALDGRVSGSDAAPGISRGSPTRSRP